MLWENVGERIEKLRNERNLSKSQFGKMIGLSGQYVGMIEKGAANISIKSIVKICSATRVSADYILFGITGSELDITAITSLHGLSGEQIEIALDIIKKVAQFINTDGGNEALIREVAAQQRMILHKV